MTSNRLFPLIGLTALAGLIAAPCAAAQSGGPRPLRVQRVSPAPPLLQRRAPALSATATPSTIPPGRTFQVRLSPFRYVGTQRISVTIGTRPAERLRIQPLSTDTIAVTAPRRAGLSGSYPLTVTVTQPGRPTRTARTSITIRDPGAATTPGRPAPGTSLRAPRGRFSRGTVSLRPSRPTPAPGGSAGSAGTNVSTISLGGHTYEDHSRTTTLSARDVTDGTAVRIRSSTLNVGAAPFTIRLSTNGYRTSTSGTVQGGTILFTAPIVPTTFAGRSFDVEVLVHGGRFRYADAGDLVIRRR